MAYGTANVDTIQSSTAGTPPQFNDGNGTQVGTLCRAWATMGTANTILASFNVSSITLSSTTRTVNFTNAMSDANYTFVCSGGDNSTGLRVYASNGTKTTTQIVLNNLYVNGGTANPSGEVFCIAIFR